MNYLVSTLFTCMYACALNASEVSIGMVERHSHSDRITNFVNTLRGDDSLQLSGIQSVDLFHDNLLLKVDEMAGTFKLMASPNLFAHLNRQNPGDLDSFEKFSLARAYYKASNKLSEKRSCIQMSYHPEVSSRNAKIVSLINCAAAAAQLAAAFISQYRWYGSCSCENDSDYYQWFPLVLATSAGATLVYNSELALKTFGVKLSHPYVHHNQESTFFACNSLNKRELEDLLRQRAHDSETERIILEVAHAR